MTYPNVYATQTGPLSLSGLDANFLYAVDIANGALSATAGGTADALTATYSPAPAALVAGLTLYLRAASANATTTPQFSPNGLTGKVIVKNNNQALAVGDIAGAGHWLQLVYDATNGVWELMNPATIVGAVQTGGTANGVAYLNASKVITSGTALTFDGTNFATTGTASATKFIPTSSSVTGNGLYLPAANALGLSTNGTNAVYIDSSQNVGIGVTPTANFGLLQVNTATNGTAAYLGNGAGVHGFNSTGYYSSAVTLSSAGTWTARSTASGIVSPTNSGTILFYTDTGLTNGNTFTPTERMRIDSSGNLGIGTSSPSGKLHVAGGANSNDFLTSSTGTTYLIMGNVDGGANAKYSYVAAASQYLLFGKVNDDFATRTEYMRIDNSGNVGIGTTSPGTKLDVVGNIRARGSASPTITFNDGAIENTLSINSSAFQLSVPSANPITFLTTNAERMRIDAVGNAQFQAGAVMPYAPAPAAISAATTLTNANIQGQIISATGTTYTITMALGTTLETLATWATTNIAYDFFVINTASGTVTMAVNTGVTSLGSLTVATGVSAHFRIRRTAANTFVMYRLV